MSDLEKHPLHPGEAPPLFIAAGVLKTPNDLAPFLKQEDPLMVPALTIGAFTTSEWQGNAKAGEQDFVYYPDRRMAGNVRGLPNPGKEGILALRDIIAEFNARGIKTIIQVTNLPKETPREVIPALVEIAASVEPTAVEVNLSCPNGIDVVTGELHPPLSSNAAASGEVIQLSRARVGWGVTLGAKDSPHVASPKDSVDQHEILELSAAIGPNIDFLTGINTIGGQPFPELSCGDGRGGMSGPAVGHIAREHLSIWKSLEPKLAYLSTGGIDIENVDTEVAARLDLGALRVGGAQEFYRAKDPVLTAAYWAIGAAASGSW